MKDLKNLVGCLFMVVLSVLCLIFLTDVIRNYYLEPKTKHRVGAKIPDHFPVLVMLQSDNSEQYAPIIVYYSQLKNVIKMHPRHSFLVPKGHEEELKKQLRSISEQFRSHPYECFDCTWFAGFEILRKDSGKQYISVRYTFDKDNINRGWYTATDKEIVPKYHQYYFGPEMGIVAILYALIGTIIVVSLVYFGGKKLILIIAKSRNST
jgi:hypothetical protein